MYLPFATKEAADERNRFQAFKKKCVPPTLYWWKDAVEVNGKWYLDVGDGEGLTEEELQRCVDELPE